MAPVLTSLDPSFGPPSGFNTVVLSGSGFAGAGPLTVRFGSTATTFTIVSDTQINAIAPPGTGTVDVTVAAALDGTSNPLPYTYGGSGLLFFTDGITPGNVYSVPQTGGTPTLLATGLLSPPGLIRVGDLLYICEAGFGGDRVSTVPVTGGTPTPLVTGLSSPFGITASGGTLFITNFGTGQVVSAPITGTATPTVIATSPTGVFGITDGASTSSVFVPAVAAPVLTSLTPSSGPPSGGNTVEIIGSGFAGAGPLTVRFGATATTFTIVSDTQINAIAPPGTGTVDVTVTAALDGTSNPLPYTYGGSGLLFFTDGITPGNVYSVPQTGGTPTLLATGLLSPRGLIRVGDLLYICEAGIGGDRVSTVPVTGGTPTPLVTGLLSPTGITVSGGTLFITNEGTSLVVSAPITGTATPTVIATSPTAASGITS
ncbi:IPT/TIG domain-containing protein [Nocardia sp. 004]|uniref:IPT/TIG domain-containing protein n=1 Tax=Nocardia sp. 004 TaxID=3385978 RepID=UPI0039A2B6CB